MGIVSEVSVSDGRYFVLKGVLSSLFCGRRDKNCPKQLQEENKKTWPSS